MKKLLLAFGLVAATFAAQAGDVVSRSFLAPGVSFIQLTNTVNVTNLNSTTKFAGAITNMANIMYTKQSQPFILFLTTTNAAGGVTNKIHGDAVQTLDVYGYGNNVLSNKTYQYTKVVGPATNAITVYNGNSTNVNTVYVQPIAADDFNLLSTVPLPHDENMSLNPYYTVPLTNSYGTISITEITTGSNTCIYVFTIVPDGSWESTVASDSFAVTVTGAAGITTTTYNVANIAPGARALRLQSITPAGSGPIGVLAVELNTTAP